MKIDKNAPAFPELGLYLDIDGNLHPKFSPEPGLPARVLLAALLLTGRFANDASDFSGIAGTHEREESQTALHWADALIAEHNATSGEEVSDG